MSMEDMRYDYQLDPQSVVLDLGAYEGTFTKRIYEQYKCQVFAFEPVVEFYKKLVPLQNADVRILNFGLGTEVSYKEMSVRNDSSSLFLDSPIKETVFIRDAVDVFRQYGIGVVDLIKINIEGGEYDLLDYLLSAGEINRFINIQVQFHSWYPDAVDRRKKIRDELIKTHYTTYDFPFVWENWRLREDRPG